MMEILKKYFKKSKYHIKNSINIICYGNIVLI